MTTPSLKDIIAEAREAFLEDPDTGRTFLTIAQGLAQLHGTDENEEKTPIRHRDAILAFLEARITAAYAAGEASGRAVALMDAFEILHKHFQQSANGAVLDEIEAMQKEILAARSGTGGGDGMV